MPRLLVVLSAVLIVGATAPIGADAAVPLPPASLDAARPSIAPSPEAFAGVAGDPYAATAGLSSCREGRFPCAPDPGTDAGAEPDAGDAPGSTPWAVVPSPNTRATQTIHYLHGVSCPSEDVCWAVGYSSRIGSFRQTLTMRWDGTRWELVPSPSSTVRKHNVLRGVTCVSETDCWAAGYQVVGTSYQTLIEHWDGNAWRIVESPNRVDQPDREPMNGNLLLAVTCASANDCWAVGYSDPPGNLDRSLTLRWDGASWALVDSPSVSTTNNSLLGVTCLSSSDCWAVGISWKNVFQTLALHWSGEAWDVVTTPSVDPERHNVLFGVACPSASDCWAVGWTGLGQGTERTLIHRWDGSEWAIVQSPNTDPSKQNVLTSIGCVASECRAGGYHWTGTSANTLVARTSGGAWTIVDSANARPNEHNALYGVACATASRCWGVGHFVDGGFDNALLTGSEGSTWSIVEPPAAATAAQDDILFGTTCVSTSNCWAVGTRFDHVTQQTLIEHWDGSSWSIVPSPNTSATQHNTLLDVTCVSASDCWAVGGFHDGTAYQTLIEHWDGTVWRIVPSPNAETPGGDELREETDDVLIVRGEDNGFYDVTCTSATSCWAVGFHLPLFAPRRPLIQRWDGSSWTIVDAPFRVSPNASTGTQHETLTGVACPSADDCWAVGWHNIGSNQYETLVLRWDGILWTPVASPNVAGAHSSFLEGIACTGPSNCWAAGPYWTGTYFQNLIARWDGSAWSLVEAPSHPGSLNSFLDNIACASASECWAVGHHHSGYPAQNLILRWDGAAWRLDDAPNADTENTNYLTSATCISAGCWAVGSVVPDDYRTLTLGNGAFAS